MFETPKHDVHEIAITTLQKKLAKEFGLTSCRLIQTSDRRQRQADGLNSPTRIEEEGQPHGVTSGIKYPYGYLVFTNADPVDEIPARKRARWKAYGKFDDLKRNRVALSSVMGLFTFTFTFVTNDASSILRLLPKWRFSAEGMGSRLSFNIRYLGVEFPYRVKPDQGFTVPEYDFDENTAKEFEFQGTITMRGGITNVADIRDFGAMPVLRYKDETGADIIQVATVYDENGNPEGVVETILEEGISPLTMRFLDKEPGVQNDPISN